METTKQSETFKDILRTCKKSLQFAWRTDRKNLTIYIVLIAIAATVVYLQLTSFSKIVDEIIFIQKHGLGITRELIKQSLLMGLFFLVPAVLNNIEAYYSTLLRNKFSVALRLYRVEKFSHLDIGTAESSEFQSKLDFAQRWGISAVSNVIFGITRSIREVVGLLVSAGILFSIDPILVVLAITGGLPGYFIAKKYQVKMFLLHHGQTNDSRVMDDRSSFFTSPKKLVEILLFNLQDMFKGQLKRVYESHIGQVMNLSTKRTRAELLEELFNTLCLLGAVGFIIYQGLSGELLIGSLVLAFATYRGFVSTTNGFYYNLSTIEEQTRYAISWFNLFELKSKIVNSPNPIKPEWKRSPKIEFRNVTFVYPETETAVLQNISFILESGEKVALVGLNGAGKTTLVKLLARVYDPTEGKILVDNIDLKDIDLSYWRENLGILFQDFSNFQMTVREAIAIARPHAPIDDEKVQWAAEVSGALDFIKHFPKQYNQLIWKGFEDGVELSKGQFQRMAVARIFYRDALISILDEPTAAIDAVAEEKIFESLETKMGNRTVILISHRFSTVKNADKIMVIEHGVIKEHGNHQELMRQQGRYADLYTMQANRYLEEGVTLN